MCVSLPRSRGDNFVVYVTDVFILNRASRGYDIINIYLGAWGISLISPRVYFLLIVCLVQPSF